MGEYLKKVEAIRATGDTPKRRDVERANKERLAEATVIVSLPGGGKGPRGPIQYGPSTRLVREAQRRKEAREKEAREAAGQNR
jgi:hypothetical protein